MQHIIISSKKVMIATNIRITQSFTIPLSEISFRTSRSGGPGGQNVNKLETRVELLYDIQNSQSIPGTLKQKLLKILSTQLNSTGVLRVVVQDSRSQWKNKQIALERLAMLLHSALRIRKNRITTKPTKTSKEKRLARKKNRSDTKRLRKVVLESS